MRKLTRPVSLLAGLLFCCLLYAQTYVGVGIRLGRDSISTGWWPYISEIIDGGTAAESNLISWKWINAVNGVSTNNLPLDEVTKMITGPEGSTVTLRIDDNGAKDFVLPRRKTINADALATTVPFLIPYRSGKLWGFSNSSKKLIISPIYERAFPFAEGLSVVQLNGKMGLINETGKEIVPIKFSWVGSVADGMIAFEEGGLYGYMNRKGVIIAPAKYNSSNSFSNGFAAVRGANGYYGFINKEGKEITPLKYDKVEDFGSRLAAVSLNNRYGFIDGTGREVVPLKYGSINMPKLTNGMYRVYDGTACGYVDVMGNEVISCRYSDASEFKNGVAAVKNGANWITINKRGEQIGTAVFGEVTGGYALNMLATKNPAVANGLYGYAKLNGEVKIPYTYKYASEFVGNLSKVTPDFSNWFIINAAGQKMLEESFKEIKLFSNGIIMLKKGDKWAYSRTNLKPFTLYKYSYAGDFSRGVARVDVAGGDGFYIDITGTEYVDAGAEVNVKAEAEKKKYANEVNALNKNPSDGGSQIKTDNLYAGYLSAADEKVNLNGESWRYLDRYTLNVKKGDRVALRMSSTDFRVVGILKSPSGNQTDYLGPDGKYISLLEIDTVLNEDGAYSLFITSAELEKEGQYSISKKIASPKALSLASNADFCTRLNFITKHAAASFDFTTGTLQSEKDNGFVTIKTWATPVELIKGVSATLKTASIGECYNTVIATSASLNDIHQKFTDYEKQIRSCLPGFEYKLKEEANSTSGTIKSLEGRKDIVRKVNLLVVKENSDSYSLNFEAE